MAKMGAGFCADGFYAGWEADPAINTVPGCIQKCLWEPECLFSAVKQGDTCSRYDSAAYPCTSRVTDADHTAYAKVPCSTVPPPLPPAAPPPPMCMQLLGFGFCSASSRDVTSAAQSRMSGSRRSGDGDGTGVGLPGAATSSP